MDTRTIEIYYSEMPNSVYLASHCQPRLELSLVGKAIVPETEWMLYDYVDYILLDAAGFVHACMSDHSQAVCQRFGWLATLNVGDCRGEYITYFDADKASMMAIAN